jgi:peptide-methionine (R)-S-oxide reductase
MLKWPDVLALAANGNPPPPRRVEKTSDQWRAQLGPEEFRVTREAGTERAFSHASCELFGPGRYRCACCGTLLFDAAEKFDSGTGWPSFTQPVEANVIAYRSDGSHGMQRIETTCNVCDAHLGHVFPDGPPPSGLRYCMNGLALRKDESAHVPG